jgi:hypothetical protein
MNTIKFLQTFDQNHTNLSPCRKFAQLRTELFAKGICWTDSVKGNFLEHDRFRVILYLKKNDTHTDFNNPMIAECNGLVLEYANKQWRCLAVPTENCTKSKISMNQVNRLFQAKRYQIYEVLDATIINMYYYEGSWKIATGKGYDVTHFQFTDSHTYAQIFNHIAATKYSKFNFNNLNHNHCYTFALRWHEFHCFNETKHTPLAKADNNDYIKLIKVTDLTTLSELNINQLYLGMPVYYPIEIKNANSISTLMSYAKNAYIKYAKGYETDNFKFKPLYGYILRSTSSSTPRAYRNIMITSSLFATIKYGLYTNSTNSIEQTVTNMFVHLRRKEQFKVLFDQYQLTFNKLEEIVSTISQEVITLINTKQYTNENPLVQAFATKVAEQFWKLYTAEGIQLTSENTQSLVYDFIHTPDYSDDLVMLLTQ